jgi:N-acetylneuraminic acid mutarotase
MQRRVMSPVRAREALLLHLHVALSLASLFVAAAFVGCFPSDRGQPRGDGAGIERADLIADRETPSVWRAGPSLPQPITNNAVAAIEIDGRVSVFSFAGMDSTKLWRGVTNVAYRWDTGDAVWREIEPVPGPGRLASTAQVIGGRIYMLGGYTVAEDGSEKSLPDVAIYDPVAESWSRGADIPVPTDDAVSGVWHGQRIVLVSGWHDSGNIRDVQTYDPATNIWTATTPIAGNPVFGHTGAITGDHIVYVDGTAVVERRPRFQIDTASWVGTIDAVDPANVVWTPAAPHPGPPLYRAAAAVIGSYALFIGGTDNPYNYDGIGYDGAPSEPIRQLLAYAPELDIWDTMSALPVATMDHRNAGVAGGRIFVVGGMLERQIVSDGVWLADVVRLLGGGP